MSKASRTDDYYFQVSLQQYRDQYSAVVNIQSRAHQLLAIDVGITSIVGAAVIVQAKSFVTGAITILAVVAILSVFCLIFLTSAALCIITMASRNWCSGPRMDQVKAKKQCLLKGNWPPGEWFGDLLQESYRDNLDTQKKLARLLNGAVAATSLMVLLIVGLAISILV